MNPYVRSATAEDVEFVAAHMRRQDADEAGALGFSPLHALRMSRDNSIVSYTLTEPDGTPGAVLGVTPGSFGPQWGAVWLLGTPSIEKFPMTFLRHSKGVLDALFERTGKEGLYNFTHEANEVHHKWLRWLGFRFLRKVSLPPFDETFIEFAKLRN